MDLINLVPVLAPNGQISWSGHWGLAVSAVNGMCNLGVGLSVKYALGGFHQSDVLRFY